MNRSQKTQPGEGATDPARGIRVADELAQIIIGQGIPSLLDGYGTCAITLGVYAAEQLLALARDGETYRRLVKESEAL